MTKFDVLLDLLRSCDSVCIGYSGGVDSVFLARAALEALGPERVLAVTGLSASVPEIQRTMARECARLMGLPHLEIDTDELEDPNYAANPSNRCYFCKSELWNRLHEVARERGLAVVLDGSNADDMGDHRPGMRAAGEQSVRSPLLEAGLTKQEIRDLSREYDLPTWDAPAAPCLASRLPYGLGVTRERLRQVEDAESGLRALGLREFRVRHHGDAARLELGEAELERVPRERETIARAVQSAGFERVLLDVEGYRRGALNESLVQLRGATSTPQPQQPVAAAGHDGSIAVVADRALDLADLQRLAPALKQQGFRYVALDITT